MDELTASNGHLHLGSPIDRGVPGPRLETARQPCQDRGDVVPGNPAGPVVVRAVHPRDPEHGLCQVNRRARPPPRRTWMGGVRARWEKVPGARRSTRCAERAARIRASAGLRTSAPVLDHAYQHDHDGGGPRDIKSACPAGRTDRATPPEQILELSRTPAFMDSLPAGPKVEHHGDRAQLGGDVHAAPVGEVVDALIEVLSVCIEIRGGIRVIAEAGAAPPEAIRRSRSEIGWDRSAARIADVLESR